MPSVMFPRVMRDPFVPLQILTGAIFGSNQWFRLIKGFFVEEFKWNLLQAKDRYKSSFADS